MPFSGPLSRGPQRLVDLLHARLAGALDRQVDHRTGRNRGPDGEAVELALQLGDHQPDRLGGARGGRNQVDRRGPRAPQVFVGHVLQALVGGVGVDRGHQPMHDADGVVEDLRHRRQAVGRARGIGDHVVLLAVVDLVEVDPQHDRRVRAARGRRDDDLPAPPARCLAALSRSVKIRWTPAPRPPRAPPRAAPPGRARPAPSARGRRSRSRPRPAADAAGVGAEDRVVLQQVGQRAGVGEVVAATNSISEDPPRAAAARSALRPMRPNPLMPTRTGKLSPGAGSAGLQRLSLRPLVRRGGYQRTADGPADAGHSGPGVGLRRRLGGAARWALRPRGGRSRCPGGRPPRRGRLAAVARGQVLGDRHRAVAPARAADRDHQVRLALGHVLRQQEVQQREQALVELLQTPVAVDVVDDRAGRAP